MGTEQDIRSGSEGRSEEATEQKGGWTPERRAAQKERLAAARAKRWPKQEAVKDDQPAGEKSRDISVPISVPEPDNTADIVSLIDRLLGEPQSEAVRRNLWKRRMMLESARLDSACAAGLAEQCRESIEFFIDHFGWQFNPTKDEADRVGPFILWDFQRRALLDTPEETGRKGLLWCIKNRRPACVAKSRELGATWLMLFLEDWLALFHRHATVGNISRDADAVDDKTPHSLFWKLRFIHRHLPEWMTGEIEDQKYYFGFKKTESFIDGEASTSKGYSGGRASLLFIDEAAKVKDLEDLRASLASVAPCKIYNSTHIGAETPFHKLSKTDFVAQITMHWTQHPDKNTGLYSAGEHGKIRFWKYTGEPILEEIPAPEDPRLVRYDFDRTGRPSGGPYPGIRSPWYDQMVQEIGTLRKVAEELDIDPSGSAFQPFDPGEIAKLRGNCQPPMWEGEVHADEAGSVTLTRRVGGSLKLWFSMVSEKPPHSAYAGGVDVAAGTGATPSCAWFTNAISGQMAGLYVNANIFPDDFAFICAALCRWFYGARIAWEHAGPGVTFGKVLLERANYWNVYRMGEEEQSLGNAKVKARAGFHPNPKAKNVALMRFYLELQKGKIACPDDDTLVEMLGFKYDQSGQIVHPHEAGKDPSVARENHGDRVMAGALSCKMVLEGGKLIYHQPQEQVRQADAEQNVLCLAGRQAMRRRQEANEDWD